MKSIAFSLFSVLALTITARCQVEQGTLTGTVSDSSGAAVPGTSVTLIEVEKQSRRLSRTNSSGSYVFPYLSPGAYDVLFEKDGFNALINKGVVITVGLTATVNAALVPGTVRQEVTVVAATVQLEQQSSDVGSVVEGQQARELPVQGRNAFTLVLMAPGVVLGNNAGNPNTASVGGGRTSTMEVLLDGAEVRNSIGNGNAYNPPLESLGEFKLITNNFSAEFGRSGGGVITASTRAGTNVFHGTGYEYFQNEALNANGWINDRAGLPKSRLRHNEYGFSLGGPAEIPRLYHGRDKTFFFVNWERIPQTSPNSAIATVPTALERSGDFSQTRNANGQLLTIYDPNSTVPNPAAAGQYIRSVFPGNMIPTSRLSPVSNKIVQYYPLPNRTTITDNFAANATQTQDITRVIFRIDQQLGSKQHFFVTHGRENDNALSPGVNLAFPSESANNAAHQINNGHSSSLSDTFVFSPSLVGEFRGTFVRRIILGIPASLGFDFTQFGLLGSLKEQSTALLFPYINVTDASTLGVGSTTNSNNTQQNVGALAHFTWSKGLHTLKTGADLQFAYLNAFKTQFSSGSYTFSRAFTQGPNPAAATVTGGNGIATFLLGLPTAGSFSIDPTLSVIQKSPAFYVQDDWKIRRNLTLNLGLRYDYASSWTERFNRLAYFDPGSKDTVTHLPGALKLLGQSGGSQVAASKKNFAPRYGFAWSPVAKTVIRGGGGMFYFPGNGAISAAPTALGDGYFVSTPVYLGTPAGAPNTPPAGASIANPFVSGLVLPPSNLVGNSISTRIHDTITPLSLQWNFGIQRALPKQILAEVTYIGSRGEHLWMPLNVNAVNPDNLSLGSKLDQQVANPFRSSIGTGTLSSATVAQSQLLRPFPQYLDINSLGSSNGDSIYHALATRLQREFRGGLFLQFSYTFGKNINNAPEVFATQSAQLNPYNLRQSRSLADWDRTHNVASNWVWVLPFGPCQRLAGKGVQSRIIGNWQLSGTVVKASGIPVRITGPSNSRLPGVNGSALRMKNPNLPSGQRTLEHWFDTTAFAPAALYSLGNDSRNQPNLRAPGLSNVNGAVSRTQMITEKIRLQLRGEFFNTLNSPPYGVPAGNISSVNFGQVTTTTTAAPGRTVQLVARLSF